MDTNSINALIVNEDALKQSPKQSGKWKTILLSLIYFVLIVVVIYEVFVGVRSFNSVDLPQNQASLNQDTPLPSALPVGNAVLALIADKSDYKIGDNIPIVVQLSTSGNLVSNVTVVVKYDPKLVSLGDDFFTIGSVYQVNPVITNSAGLLRISADAGSPLNGFGGVGNVGVVNFTAKVAGNVNINIENSSDTSQVIDFLSKKNILGEVANLSVQVK